MLFYSKHCHVIARCTFCRRQLCVWLVIGLVGVVVILCIALREHLSDHRDGIRDSISCSETVSRLSNIVLQGLALFEKNFENEALTTRTDIGIGDGGQALKPIVYREFAGLFVQLEIEVVMYE